MFRLVTWSSNTPPYFAGASFLLRRSAHVILPVPAAMTQVALLDSARLSSLLKDALTWSDSVASLLVSAKNGSILAYTCRDSTPSIKTLPTKSTTMTAAYSASADDTLILESQDTAMLSVITSVGDHLLLAVSGDEQKKPQTKHAMHSTKPQPGSEAGDVEEDGEMESEGDTQEIASRREDIRQELEEVSSELADVLRDELQALRWPYDI